MSEIRNETILFYFFLQIIFLVAVETNSEIDLLPAVSFIHLL